MTPVERVGGWAGTPDHGRTTHPSPAAPAGQPDRLPLLLLPGTLCDRRLFEPVIAALDGYPFVVAELTGADTAPDMARRILAQAPPRFALAGFSLGGIVALEMAAQAPERIAALALIDTTARPDPAHNAAARRRALAEAGERGIEGFILDAWDTLVAPENRTDATLRETILAMARAGGLDALACQTGVAIERADSRPRLAAIRVPTLVLAGEWDEVCPPHAQREIAEGVPDAAFFTIPQAGHFAPLENPRAVAFHLRRWLGIGLDAAATFPTSMRAAP